MDPILRKLIGDMAAVGFGLLPTLIDRLDSNTTKPKKKKLKPSSVPHPRKNGNKSIAVVSQEEVNANLRAEVEALRAQLKFED